VPAETLDIQNVFILSFSSAEKFRRSATFRPREFHCKIFSTFSLSAERPTLCSRTASWKINE